MYCILLNVSFVLLFFTIIINGMNGIIKILIGKKVEDTDPIKAS